jgi:hypothetical protein
MRGVTTPRLSRSMLVKYLLFIRKSHYRDFPDVLRRNPQIRFYTAFRLRYVAT